MVIDFVGVIEQLKKFRESSRSLPDPLRFLQEKININFVPANELNSYSSALTQADEWDWAEQIARSIKDNEDEKGQALAILAQRLAYKESFNEAIRIASSIPNDPAKAGGALIEKVVALTYIASGLAKAEALTQAYAVVVDAENILEIFPYTRPLKAHLLCDLAEICNKIRQKDAAFNLWEKAVAIASEALETDETHQYPTADSRKALMGIITSIAEAGEMELAKEMIQKYVNVGLKEFLLTTIIEIE